MNRFVYTLLLYAAAPLVWMRLLWKARRQREYLRHWGERYGWYASRQAPRPLLWLHAVSVGETRAAEPLVRALRERYPGHRVLVTHMTPTGRETGERLFGETVERCYLPYDYPGAVGRFLAHYRPVLGVLMETEIWPNLVRACAQRRVPLYLVNARLSAKSQAGYARHRALAHEALDALAGIAAQTQDDAARFTALGATRVTVTGNVKFDIEPPSAMLALGARWRAAYGERPVLLAASTRDGEEALILDALREHALPGALLVIVPRHPERFDAVAALLAARGVAYQHRSADAPVERATTVLLGDSMGEMFAYYAACDVAFIGGSLLPFGSQNLIEACAVGKPVLIGSHTYNFAEAAELAVAAGAAMRVADAAMLLAACRELFADRERAAGMGRAGLEFCRGHRGATRRVMALLRPTGAAQESDS
jgi:3-deoxy-D-manno-octulosonic-acid transferase